MIPRAIAAHSALRFAIPFRRTGVAIQSISQFISHYLLIGAERIDKSVIPSERTAVSIQRLGPRTFLLTAEGCLRKAKTVSNASIIVYRVNMAFCPVPEKRIFGEPLNCVFVGRHQEAFE